MVFRIWPDNRSYLEHVIVFGNYIIDVARIHLPQLTDWLILYKLSQSVCLVLVEVRSWFLKHEAPNI